MGDINWARNRVWDMRRHALQGEPIRKALGYRYWHKQTDVTRPTLPIDSAVANAVRDACKKLGDG